MISLPFPFARHLGRPVRRFSALDAFRLQQALPLPGFEPVPPRGPGRPRKFFNLGSQSAVAPAHGKRSAGAGATALSAPVLVGGASNTSQTAQK